MKRTTHTPSLAYYRALVQQTRRYGSCYLHAGLPATYSFGTITFRVTAYGRSLQSGGHKYKAYALRDGRPVLSTELLKLNS